MPHNVLLTGFEPFLSYDYNPSGKIVKKLDRKTISGAKIIGKVLPVRHIEVRDIINNYISQYNPISIISIGIKATIGCISLERLAVNCFYFRNNKDEIDELLDKNGPAAYLSTLPLNQIKDSLQSNGIPAEYSFFPDTYVSNEVFYEVMKTAKKSNIKRAGFIHIPISTTQLTKMNNIHYTLREKIPNMEEKMIEEAIKIAIKTTVNSF